MSIIKLKLAKQDDFSNILHHFDDIVKNENLIVILGAPGSGKTTMLETYQKDHQNNCEFKKINEVLKLKPEYLLTTDILLLDGLDEYRCAEQHKTLVLTELGNVINNLTKIKTVVISCREMDWYGEFDKNSLKSKVGKVPSVYCIQSLDDNQKEEFAKLLKITDLKDFIKKYYEFGFLETPQLFKMTAKIHKNNSNFTSKKELFDKFIEESMTEINPHHKFNMPNELTLAIFFKQIGYLAFYYIFCNVDNFDETILTRICDEKNYNKKHLEYSLKTNLFKAKTFVHRTIAEYALAKFIFQNLFNDKNRIKGKFISSGLIATEKRGTYAWLCSLSANEELIKIDPYYQLIHGDNSMFNSELKKKIILEVKNYALQNRTFFNFDQISGLSNFYNSDLDNFLIQEFNEGLNLKNYYIYLIIYIFNTSGNLSNSAYEFLQMKIQEKNIETSIKYNILKGFNTENRFGFLAGILEKIKKNEISDERDNLKEQILKTLYQKRINSIEIVEYLPLYKEKVIGHCFYLYKTPYTEKQKQITLIYENAFREGESIEACLPVNIESYLEDYFLETILKYEEEFSAKQIYEFLIRFKRFYKVYEAIPIRSYRYEITDKLKASDQKIAQLSKELFCFFIEDLIEKNNLVELHFFKYLFSLRLPNNISTLILEKMDKKLSKENNKALLLRAFAYSPVGNNQEYIDLAKSKAKEFDLNDALEERLNPPKNEWDEELELRKKASEEEVLKRIESNEKHFFVKSEMDIQNCFDDLFFIAKINFFEERENVLTLETFNRLKKVLANAIYHKPLNPDLQTLQSLAHESPEARRNIDTLYYASCYLNNEKVDFVRLNKRLIEYYYINSLLHSKVYGINKSDFHLQLEQKDSQQAREILLNYLMLLIKKYLPKMAAILQPYLITQNDLDELKLNIYIQKLEGYEFSDSLLFNLLKTINFNIKAKDLRALFKKPMCLRNKNIVEALLVFAEQKRSDFTELMAISIYSIFDYNIKRFEKLDNESRIRLIDYMIKNFSRNEDLVPVDGTQSSKDECITFLRHNGLEFELNYLKRLKELHNDLDDIWSLLISQKINELSQREVDALSQTYEIDKIKNFILSEEITSYKDFFSFIYSEVEKLKDLIQGDIDSDMKPFYNTDNSPKDEGSCRDAIVNRLKDRYRDVLIFNREKLVSNNRTDISLAWLANQEYIVQIECKRNNNPDIFDGIPNQLIKKYLVGGVNYGIYLVFFFGAKKIQPNVLFKSLSTTIPKSKLENVKIIIIDLRRPTKNTKKTNNRKIKTKPKLKRSTDTKNKFSKKKRPKVSASNSNKEKTKC